MTNINTYITILLLLCSTVLFGQSFTLVGDAQDNYPTKIKSFNNAVYIAGYYELDLNKFATFHKYDKNGVLLWEVQLKASAQILDFEYDAVNDRFLLVGRSEPFEGANNQSLLAIIDDSGILIEAKLYEQSGREEFTSIVQHPNPIDANYPYYILGTRNPIGSSLAEENIPVLWNIDANGNSKWLKSYTLLAKDTIEGEIHRGLIALPNGDLALLGNAITEIDSQDVTLGAMALVDGAGDFDEYYLFSGTRQSLFSTFILEDGVVLPSNQLAIIGHDSETQTAFITITNKVVSKGLEYGLQFENIAAFEEIGLDSLGRLYAIGQEKFNTKRNVLFRFNSTNTSLSIDYAKFIDGNTQQVYPHIHITPASNEIFYTDARQRQATNNFDIFLGLVDLDFNSDCTDDFLLDTLVFRKEAIKLVGTSNTDSLVNFTEIEQTALHYSMEQVTCLSPCSIDFSWNQDSCRSTSFYPNINQEYENFNWNFAGLGNSDKRNPEFSFPNSGTYYVCLTAGFKDGTRCIDCQNITIEPDTIPPSITCPNDTILYATINCQAPFNPIITIDDCDLNNTLACQLSGQTSGTKHHTKYNLGVTIVDCRVADSSGNSSACNFVITVLDTIPPILYCPDDKYFSMPIGQDSARVDFPQISPFDCSELNVYNWTHLPNDNFKFGETPVLGIATDIYDNSSTCSFSVIVDYAAAFISAESFSCTEDTFSYDYQIVLNDFAENGQPKDSCTIEVTSPSEAIVNSEIIWTENKAEITGTITVDEYPYISPLELNVNLTCSFDDKEIKDSLAVSFELCCAAISVKDTSFCIEEPRIILPIIPNNRFSTKNIKQTTWYIKANSFDWLTWSSGKGFFPLEATTKLGSFLCYAEVLLNNQEQPCRILYSDTAFVKIDANFSAAEVIGSSSYCYSGGTITPDELYITNLPKPIPESIQWRDEKGDIPGATQLTYQPPDLSLDSSFQNCNKVFKYEVVLTNACGQKSYPATIRLDNNNAPKAEIQANKSFPLCAGEDLELSYEPNCTGESKEWNWYQSYDNRNYRSIPGAGNSNGSWNTNSIYEDTWFRVVKENGECRDTIDLPVKIKEEPIAVFSFNAAYDEPCEPESVLLSVDIVPEYWTGFKYEVNWILNCDIIHTSTHKSPSAKFTYTGANLAGNYYVNVITTGCKTRTRGTAPITLDPASELHITGPCFRCNNETITLNSTVLNLPRGGDCSYTWSTLEGGNIVDGQGTSSINVNANGVYILTANCEGCIKVDTFNVLHNVLQCGNGSGSQVPKTNSDKEEIFAVDIYPNPASNQLFLKISPVLDRDLIVKLYTVNRQLLVERKLPPGTSTQQFNIEELPSALYWIEIQQADKLIWSEKFVK